MGKRLSLQLTFQPPDGVKGEKSGSLCGYVSANLLNESRAASGAKLQQTKRGSKTHSTIWCFELAVLLDHLLFITGEGDFLIAATI